MNMTVPDLKYLNAMHPCEFEEWRERGEAERQVLTRAVARLLTVPEGWTVNGEYRREYGGFFPVQLRFEPPGAGFSLCVCSPGDVSGEWIVIMVSADGGCVRDVLRLTPFSPSRISGLMVLAGQACLLEYTVAGMADYLTAEVCV